MANAPTAFHHADASFHVCQLVAGFVDEQIRPRVDHAVERDRSLNLHKGLLLRAIAWLRSLGKLNHPGDWQAAAAGSRSMFEIALDLVLLDEGGEAAREKLEAWEESAKLRAAELACDFYVGGRDHDGTEPAQVAFVRHDGDRIRDRRRRFWGNSSHPPRWTGNGIRADAERADAHLDRGFRSYHLKHYTQHCWATHGSTIVGLREISEVDFPAYTAFAFEHASTFALVCAEACLRCTGLWGPAIEDLFREHTSTLNVQRYIRLFIPNAVER